MYTEMLMSLTLTSVECSTGYETLFFYEIHLNKGITIQNYFLFIE